MIRSQLDPKDYYIGPCEDYDQGMPAGCVAPLPPEKPWPPKKWPKYDQANKKFVMIDDHRERSSSGGFAADLVQPATEYWLAEDTHDSPARYVDELGPLPAGASLTKPIKTTAEICADKAHEINAGCEAALRLLTTSYPDLELLTFDKQENEARAYLADPAAPVPILSSIAAGRGMPLADLASKVIAKAEAFAAASGYFIGQRQKYEDQLDALGPDATTKQIEGIVVAYRLPGLPDAAKAAQGM